MARVRSRFIRACIALALLVAATARAVPPSSSELKAAFLIAFGDFVQWPGESRERAPQPLVIAVLNSPEMAERLERLAALEPHPHVEVLRLTRVTPDTHCHILYVPPESEDAVPWSDLAKRPVLLVGESAEFETRGGIIRFLVERNRVRLRVNLPAIDEHDLNVSSRLLRVAEVRKDP
jgi:hypothetical protein